MPKRKWDKYKQSCDRYEYKLKAEYMHKSVKSVWLEFEIMGKPRRNAHFQPLYSVRIVGDRKSVFLSRKSGRMVCSLATAKRKALMYADWPWWLLKYGVVKCPECQNEHGTCPECEWVNSKEK